MKYLLAAASFALLATPAALATEIDVGYSTDFQEKLQDDYGAREGTYLADSIREDLMREFKAAGLNGSRPTSAIPVSPHGRTPSALPTALPASLRNSWLAHLRTKWNPDRLREPV